MKITDPSANRFKQSPSVAALAAMCALVAPSVFAADITVNSLQDTIVTDSQCTLREAIANANGNSDVTGGDCGAGSAAATDYIRFSVSGVIDLSASLNVSDRAGLVIDGDGQSITLNGKNSVRVLHIQPAAVLTLQYLTIANGMSNRGGGVYNQYGRLTVVGSTFTANAALTGFASGGGAIANDGDPTDFNNPGGWLVVANSTFSGNSGSNGGAILNGWNGSLSLTNSTLVGNSVITPACSGLCTQTVGTGGAIMNNNAGLPANLNNSIVAGNQAVIERSNLTPLVYADDLSGTALTGNQNLIGQGIVQGTANLFNVDAATVVNATLASNGGSTQTLALLSPGSAIDTGLDSVCASDPVNGLDQRKLPRNQGAHCDIGAFEASQATVDLVVSQSATPSPVMIRDRLYWTIQVQNQGITAASGVILENQLPTSGISSVTKTTSTGTCTALSGGKINCNLGVLNPGAYASVSISYIPGATGTVTHTAKAATAQTEIQLTNNTATQTISVEPLLCNGLKPTIVGTPGADILKGTKGKDIIQGLGGNDTITGAGDQDTLCGGEGNDSISGEAGNDFMDGGAGIDLCNGGTGTDASKNCESSVSVP